MVWFRCEDCGDNLKKPKLPNHFRQCSAFKLSCIDCGQVFGQQEVEGHTQCITEAEKYGPEGPGKASNGVNTKPQNAAKKRPEVDINVGLSERPPWFLPTPTVCTAPIVPPLLLYKGYLPPNSLPLTAALCASRAPPPATRVACAARLLRHPPESPAPPACCRLLPLRLLRRRLFLPRSRSPHRRLLLQRRRRLLRRKPSRRLKLRTACCRLRHCLLPPAATSNRSIRHDLAQRRPLTGALHEKSPLVKRQRLRLFWGRRLRANHPEPKSKQLKFHPAKERRKHFWPIYISLVGVIGAAFVLHGQGTGNVELVKVKVKEKIDAKITPEPKSKQLKFHPAVRERERER